MSGAPDIKGKLLKGVELNGRTYKNHIDGYNMLDYLSGKTDASPRPAFIYVNDDGDIVAVRWNDWKVVYKENRGQGFGVWREPFTELRVPLVFNLRRDPFERAQHNANVYEDWALDRPFIIFGAMAVATQFLTTLKEFPPSQTPGSFNLDNVQKADRVPRRKPRTDRSTPPFGRAAAFFPMLSRNRQLGHPDGKLVPSPRSVATLHTFPSLALIGSPASL